MVKNSNGLGNVKPPPIRRKTGTILILALILAGAAFLRLHRLGDRPLYFDEPHHTVLPATRPLPEVLRTNYGSVLYPALVHVLLPAGQVGAMARLPAAVFGILAVAVLFLIGRHIFGKREAVVAALFAATSGPFIYFSQQARAYTGLLLFSLLALYFLMRAVKDNGWIFWAGYAASMILGAYLHIFQLVLFPVHGSALVLWTAERWRRRHKDSDGRGSSDLRPLLRFSAAAAVSLAAIFLLHLPTRNVSAGEVSLFGLLESGVRGLFSGRTGPDLASFMQETFARLLDYRFWPLLFFAKILLAAAGLVFCLKGRARESVLFLVYLTLPFILFVFSNPSDVYTSAADNKFIFVTPILFLLMARGFSAIDDFAARKKPARTVWRVVFAAVLIFGEGAGLLEYRRTQWEGMSLQKNRKVVSAMAEYLDSEALVFSGGPVNPLAFVFARPVRIPGTGRPGILFYEAGDMQIQSHQNGTRDVWAIVRTRKTGGELALEAEIIPDRIEIRSIPPFTLIRHSDPEKTLLDKALEWLSLSKTLPGGDERRRHLDLSRAHLNLIAGRNAAALEILDSLSLRRSGEDSVLKPGAGGKIRFAPRLSTASDIDRMFHENINSYLLGQARQALNRGDPESAADLLDRIMPADRHIDQVRFDAHALRAEAFLAREMADDAVLEYAGALRYAPSPDVEAPLVRRIGEIRGVAAGVLIRQSAEEIHIRWWSDRRREFSGRVDISEPITRFREFRLTEADRHRSGRDKLEFTGISSNGFVKGLTLVTKRPARCEIRIRIPGLLRPEDHIIVIPDPENPGGLVLR